jgi:hypothetical protein
LQRPPDTLGLPRTVTLAQKKGKNFSRLHENLYLSVARNHQMVYNRDSFANEPHL